MDVPIAAGARPVFHDGLAQLASQRFGHQPRQRVAAAAAKGTTRVMAWVGQAGSAWAVQNASDAQAAATVPIKLL